MHAHTSLCLSWPKAHSKYETKLLEPVSCLAICLTASLLHARAEYETYVHTCTRVSEYFWTIVACYRVRSRAKTLPASRNTRTSTSPSDRLTNDDQAWRRLHMLARAAWTPTKFFFIFWTSSCDRRCCCSPATISVYSPELCVHVHCDHLHLDELNENNTKTSLVVKLHANEKSKIRRITVELK